MQEVADADADVIEPSSLFLIAVAPPPPLLLFIAVEKLPPLPCPAALSAIILSLFVNCECQVCGAAGEAPFAAKLSIV